MIQRDSMSELLKQAQKMQHDLEKAQSELAAINVEGKSGGGLVKVRASYPNKIHQVSISPSLFESNDKDMLEDLILTATNDALRQLEALAAERLGSFTAGLQLPPGLLPSF